MNCLYLCRDNSGFTSRSSPLNQKQSFVFPRSRSVSSPRGTRRKDETLPIKLSLETSCRFGVCNYLLLTRETVGHKGMCNVEQRWQQINVDWSCDEEAGGEPVPRRLWSWCWNKRLVMERPAWCGRGVFGHQTPKASSANPPSLLFLLPPPPVL